MSAPIGSSKNIINLKAMSGSEDGLDRERSTSMQVFKYSFNSIHIAVNTSINICSNTISLDKNFHITICFS